MTPLPPRGLPPHTPYKICGEAGDGAARHREGEGVQLRPDHDLRHEALTIPLE